MKSDLELDSGVRSKTILTFLKEQDRSYNRIYLRSIPSMVPIHDLLNANSFNEMATGVDKEPKRKNAIIQDNFKNSSRQSSLDMNNPLNCDCADPGPTHACKFYDRLDDSFGIFNPGFKDINLEEEIDSPEKSKDSSASSSTPDYLFIPIDTDTSAPSTSNKYLSLPGSIPKSKSTDFYDYESFHNDLIFPYPKAFEKNVVKNQGALEAPFVLNTPKPKRNTKLSQCKSDNQIFQENPADIFSDTSKYILPIPDGSESTTSSSRAGSIYELQSYSTSKSSSIDHGTSSNDLRLDNFHQSEYLQFKTSQNSLNVPMTYNKKAPHLEKRSFSLPQSKPDNVSPRKISTTNGTPVDDTHKHDQVEVPRYFTPVIISDTKESDGDIDNELNTLLSDKKTVAYGRKKSLVERRKLLRESKSSGSSSSFNSSFESHCELKKSCSGCIVDRKDRTSSNMSRKMSVPTMKLLINRNQDSIEEEENTVATRRQIFARSKSKKSIEPSFPYSWDTVGHYVPLESAAGTFQFSESSDSSTSSSSSDSSSCSSSDSSDLEDLP